MGLQGKEESESKNSDRTVSIGKMRFHQNNGLTHLYYTCIAQTIQYLGESSIWYKLSMSRKENREQRKVKGSWYLLLRQVVSQVYASGQCMWNTSETYSPTIPVPSALIFGLMSLSGSSPHTRGQLGAGWAAPPYWGAGQSMAGSGPARAVRVAGLVSLCIDLTGTEVKPNCVQSRLKNWLFYFLLLTLFFKCPFPCILTT